MNPKVDAYLARAEKWRGEMVELRKILLDYPLTEELKWGKPCYAFQEKNAFIIIPFKESCALMFCKGALLKDAKGLLAKPGENTQAGRWLKFTQVREIKAMESTLRAYIQEAIEAEKAGLQVKFKKVAEFKVPEELRHNFAKDAALKKAFKALTPGRQRGYLLHFSSAKQSKTREARIAKCRPQILKGEGLNERRG